MNEKTAVLVIFVEAIICFLLYNLYDCIFNHSKLKTQNRPKKTQKTQKQKPGYPKEQLENADLHKPV